MLAKLPSSSDSEDFLKHEHPVIYARALKDMGRMEDYFKACRLTEDEFTIYVTNYLQPMFA